MCQGQSGSGRSGERRTPKEKKKPLGSPLCLHLRQTCWQEGCRQAASINPNPPPCHQLFVNMTHSLCSLKHMFAFRTCRRHTTSAVTLQLTISADVHVEAVQASLSNMRALLICFSCVSACCVSLIIVILNLCFLSHLPVSVRLNQDRNTQKSTKGFRYCNTHLYKHVTLDLRGFHCCLTLIWLLNWNENKCNVCL